MRLETETIRSLTTELQPLVGARVQRVDEVDTHELVLELRCPGRTLWLLLCGRRGAARAHLVAARPPKLIPPSGSQGAARRRLEGRPVRSISASAQGIELTVPGTKLFVALDGAPKPIRFEELSEPTTGPDETLPVPAHFPVSDSIRARTALKLDRAALDRLKRSVLDPLRAKRKRLEKLLENLDRDLKKLVALEAERRSAELLKTVLGRVKRGQSTVEVLDYATGASVTVALDPSLDVKANMERSFQRAKRGARGRLKVEERHRKVLDELAIVVAEMARAEAASADELRSRLEGRAEPTEKSPKSDKRDPLARHARRFVSLDGLEIRVGKGAEGNDRLTASARGHEIWLHARGVPGAHVLIRLEKHRALPEPSLLDAAHLAAFFSDAKREPTPEIVYAEARYVKKTKGAPAGAVSISREKTLHLRVEPARLARLLGRDPTLSTE
ncbi:MAG: DUF814 domain-containing protein [Deltaproteobacteria bacterium]|nr:DUF814 domain-containing protein [Deltaproteobacteria bacterium]